MFKFQAVQGADRSDGQINAVIGLALVVEVRWDSGQWSGESDPRVALLIRTF